MATNLAAFDDVIDVDLMATVAGLGPASLSPESLSMSQAALAYAVGPTLDGVSALQLIHAAEAIIGNRVDFTG